VKVSLRWLGRHADLSGIAPDELAARLTLHTAEVEGLEPFAPALSEVVVGHVVERTAHPNADKLSLCRVDLGNAGPGELVQIVCGAPNVAAGQRVAVARVGASLPGDVKIKKGKIRGEDSNGMICSVRELGLGDEHDGIWVLPGMPSVGVPVARALGIEDWVLEIDNKALTHRPDCWGHRGLAREAAALFGRALKPLDLSPPATAGLSAYPLEVASLGCSRYLALALDGVQNGESPLDHKLLLLAVGQRPIDLLVDLSNFVMLDLGQPNHVFDRRRLAPAGIRVRDARPGERMRTLDGVERLLEPEDLLICNGDAPVALAGVMGGEATGVAADTRELLLEVATFHPARVRRTAMRLGLRTDASARFEKNLDPTLPAQAAGHFLRLLREAVPTVVASAWADAGRWSDPKRTIRLRPARVRSLLGIDLDDAAIAAELARVGLAATRSGPGAALEVAIPSARATKDLSVEEDLIEEVGRLVGYERIPERVLVAEVRPPPYDPRRTLVRLLQDRLAGAALFHEAPTYTFLPEELARATGVLGESYVTAVNPVLESWQRIRRSVLPGLLGKLEDNLRRYALVRLFDIAKGYLPEAADAHGEPAEVHELALVLAQPVPARAARFDAGALPLLQSVVADALAAAGRPLVRFERAALVPPFAHQGRALAGFAAGSQEPVAHVAALEPGVARALGQAVAASDVALAWVSLDRVLATPEEPSAYRPLPRFPSIKIDVACAVSEETPAGDVAQAIERAGKGLAADVELFDLYRGESVGEGRKSLAFHVVLQASDKTLGEADGQKFLDRLGRALAEAGGELRRD
jgi:phenylalanyl-tRNA synthetase beta chain